MVGEVFIDVQNVCHFTAAKGPKLRQSHATQRRTALRCGGLKSLGGATQR